ncbi:MAG: hypothetical protein EPO02_13075 [Nitrospirae bacterium]|nr:MAG: hypothetical protein EPO02_13075 [Nitrospirota bacterium]
MSLLTDSDQVSGADLRAIDYEVADVAETHKLTLEGDGSVIRGAWEECAEKLLAAFQNFGSGSPLGPFGVIPNLLYWNWPAGTTNSAISLSQVVASDPLNKRSVLQRWLTLCALENVYRAVANASQEDRYKKKQAAYDVEAAKAWRLLSRLGLPVVSQPLPAPGALHEPGAGTFSGSDIGSVVTGSAADQPVEISITWWDSVRSAESGPSLVIGYDIPDNAVLTVSRANCVPPAAATHWNVYVSALTGQPLTRQVQLPIATTSWAAPGAIAATATQLGPGQAAERNIAFSNFLQRA